MLQRPALPNRSEQGIGGGGERRSAAKEKGKGRDRRGGRGALLYVISP